MGRLIVLWCAFFMVVDGAAQVDDRVATIGVLIERGLSENENAIREQAIGLSDVQRLYMFDQYERGAGLPFVLNLFLGFGIGSWVQGHTAGGLIGSIGGVAGVGMMASAENNQTVGTIGAIVFLGSYITDLILPWTYASGYNRTLRRALAMSGSADLRLSPGVRSYAFGPVVPQVSLQLQF